MVAQSLIDTVFALPFEDRVELLRQLEDNLRDDPAAMLSDEHKRILDERLADLAANPNDGAPWEDVERRIKAALDRA